MQENLSMRPVLGVVLAVEERMAQVRLFLAGGGVVEERLPSIGTNLLEAGAAVVVIFLGDDPSSGVIVGALDGASFAAALGHLHDDRYYTRSTTDTLLAGKADSAHPHAALVAWTQFDQAVQDIMLDSLPDTATVQWDKTTAGLSVTVCGVRTLSTAERDALAAVNGILIYNTTNGQFEGRAGGAWVVLG